MQDLHALAGAYAIDAVSDEERERFERHLRRCQQCETEVREMRATATMLGLAAAEAPPAQMKARVLTAASRTRQLAPETEPVRVRPTQPRWRLAVAGGLAAACAAVAIGLGFGLANANHQLGQARADQHAVAAVLAAPDARILSTSSTTGGEATLVVSTQLKRLVFVTSDLPALSDARVYQLWLIAPGRTTSVGLLPPAEHGQTAPVLATGLGPGDKIGLTVEPAGGTTQPTTTPIVLIRLPS
jgi:anti-sigma-K factor RskA